MVRPLLVEDGKTLIDISRLDTSYPQFTKSGIRMRCLINRIFSEDGSKAVTHPRIVRVFDILKPETYSTAKLDLSSYALSEGIPKGYHVEVLAINFVYGKTENHMTTEFPIYPGEVKTDLFANTPYRIGGEIGGEMDALNKVGQAFETIGSLHQADLHEVAVDLGEGLLRVERNDHEGAIKFFRKVVEGLRLHCDDKIFGSEKRYEEVKRFLSASFSLMSNFGEHTGTHGWIDEASLSKEISVGVSRYMLTALTKERQS